MTAPKNHREDSQRAFPRSRDHQPNLATLDRLRGLRRPRLMAPAARRHQVPQECSTC
ncbi:MAG TPA: hypothetical protein VFJ22_04620 [Dermatophilaceae bacterium]|nr:hypothetical protein [Dermatophilaceae bacterium]